MDKQCWLCGRNGLELVMSEGHSLCHYCRVERPVIEILDNFKVSLQKIQADFQKVAKQLDTPVVADIEIHLRKAEMIFQRIAFGKDTAVIFGQGE